MNITFSIIIRLMVSGIRINISINVRIGMRIRIRINLNGSFHKRNIISRKTHIRVTISNRHVLLCVFVSV